MKKRLLNIIVCPECKSYLKPRIFNEKRDEIIDGLLTCKNCNESFPIINHIPRLLPGKYQAYVKANHNDFFEKYQSMLPEYLRKTKSIDLTRSDELKIRTLKSFGYQWTRFKEMHKEFKMNFLNYIYPLKEVFFKNKIGLDAGCGFGRHIYYAAKFGSDMVGLDFSEAVEVAHENTKMLPNVHIVQGDIYNPPFKKSTFDFVYSIGVLHHLPMPEKAFNCLIPLIKKKGHVFIWVYSKARPVSNLIIESIRTITNKLPLSVIYILSYLAAVVDWSIISLYKAIRVMPFLGKIIVRINLPRIKLYAKYPFQVCFADWFDRLSPAIRFYYDKRDMELWFKRAKLSIIKISPTGLYGWRALGKK